MIDGRLTVLLALKDRVQFTCRWMRYANEMRFPFKILLADGGADERLPGFLSNRLNFPNLDYEYIRYPFDETYAHYYAKLVDALERVKTPFVVMADNDDFFVVDGLTRSLDFLQNHPDYSSSRGIIGGVIIKPDDQFGKFKHVYGKKEDLSFAAQVYPPGSTLDDTAMMRVQNQYACFRSNWYDVYRTELAREMFQTLKDLNTQDLILAEFIPSQLGYLAGKIYRGPFLYLVRQVKGPGSSAGTEILEKGDHFDRMLLPSWSQDITDYINAIAAAVSQKDGIPVEDARRLVRQGYRNFMAPLIIDCLHNQIPLTNRWQLVQNLIVRANQFKIFLRGLINPSSLVNHFEPAPHFVASHHEFKPIFQFITALPASTLEE